MAGSYVKLFGSILTSSVWCESPEPRLVWITLLVLADGEGRVWGAVPGIAREAGVSVEAARVAIERLSSPDPHSRTKDEEGRRLVPIDGGWRIVTAQKYRDMQTDGQRKASARAKAYRQRKAERNVTQHDARDASRSSSTEGEEKGEVDVERKGRKETRPPARPHTDVHSEQEHLAEKIISEATAIARASGWTRTRIIKAASRIPASNGHPEKCFGDPRAIGISIAWLEATLKVLPEVRASILRPVPL